MHAPSAPPAPNDTPVRCRQCLDQLRRELLDARTESGHWVGELAASALSTATAASALSAVLLNRDPDQWRSQAKGNDVFDESSLRSMIRQAMHYLAGQQNADGGFGDTDRSHSNIATSYLVLSASTLAGKIGERPLADDAVDRLNRYLDQAGRLDGLRRRYGKDKTFVVPIMNNMAIAGLISWDDVAALPFEAAVFPQSMYRFLQMPVVSYAIPALVAIGQARHFMGRRALAPIRLVRSLAINRTLAVLKKMQPASGGYLEATPLTAFVVMSLAATGRCELSVVRSGLRFLTESMLPGGSWPIDTNLATWVTSLSIHALACDPADDGGWYSDALADWHLDCQHVTRHPFTGAEPGGWGWTDLSGAVPDSDDTPAAILALGRMRRYADGARQSRIDDAVSRGTQWLLRLQNRNGGWPTFCRGWGKLPFDRSSTDLTAHAMRALTSIRAANSPAGHSTGIHQPTEPRRDDFAKPLSKAVRFLTREQNADGSWMPLWFGNQDRDDESNPIYGTAKVLIAGGTGDRSESAAEQYLLESQNPDGGWGGGPSLEEKIRHLAESDREFTAHGPQIPPGLTSSVEETALAVEALTTLILRNRDETTCKSLESGRESTNGRSDRPTDGLTNQDADSFAAGNDAAMAAILRGVEFLMQSVEDRRHRIAWPIGFYFAKLWYHERLYPLIFTTAALGKFLRVLEVEHRTDWPQ